MALILEVRDRHGRTTWHPLFRLPLTLGRGLSNDIILDDPYVDAQHIGIAMDDSGEPTARDLGSVNGVFVGGARAGAAIAIRAGTELRIGRTALRFHDQDEAVPPALVESTRRAQRISDWALSGRAGLLLVVAVSLLTALVTWLGSSERSNGGTVLAAVVAAVGSIAVWAGIWAVAVRGADRRFHGRAHLAVASAAFLVVLLYSTLNDWMVFFFPDVELFDVAFSTMLLFVVAGLVVGHLTVAGVMTQRRRWRAGLAVSATIVLLVLAATLVEDEDFSDVPKFPGQLKPVMSRLVPTLTVDEFVQTMGEARSEADEALER